MRESAPWTKVDASNSYSVNHLNKWHANRVTEHKIDAIPISSPAGVLVGLVTSTLLSVEQVRELALEVIEPSSVVDRWLDVLVYDVSTAPAQTRDLLVDARFNRRD